MGGKSINYTPIVPTKIEKLWRLVTFFHSGRFRRARIVVLLCSGTTRNLRARNRWLRGVGDYCRPFRFRRHELLGGITYHSTDGIASIICDLYLWGVLPALGVTRPRKSSGSSMIAYSFLIAIDTLQVKLNRDTNASANTCSLLFLLLSLFDPRPLSLTFQEIRHALSSRT